MLENSAVAIRCFDRRAGSAPDPMVLSPDLADVPLVRMRQVHGGTVVLVDRSAVDVAPPEADGLLSVDAPISLVVRTADCVPLVLWSPASGVVAAVHAGWRGLVAGIVPTALQKMVEQGSRTDDIRAWVGPSICGGCYPVGSDVQQQIVDVVPSAQATSRQGEPAADVGVGAIEQLRAFGLDDITVDGRCTRESPDLFSARGGDAIERLQIVVTAKAAS